MPKRNDVRIDVSDVALRDPDGYEESLGSLPGVWVVVLLRHRH